MISERFVLQSTTYGRQNPITERWNSESQLILWRSAWADIVNLHLERVGSAERVDHRSHAERGLDEQPTIHEGIAARAMEKKGIVSDRCELNRQIKADNALLRELKELVQQLTEAVSNTAANPGERLAALREMLLVFCYQLRFIGLGKEKLSGKVNVVQPILKQYAAVMQQIKQKIRERKDLLAEQKQTSRLNLLKQHDLARQIATVTEELEELRSEKENLLITLACADDAGVKAVQEEVTAMEVSLHRLDEQEEKYTGELDAALRQYKELQTQADVDESALSKQEAYASAAARLQELYGDRYRPQLLRDSQKDVAKLLGESDAPQSIRAWLQQHENTQRKPVRHESSEPQR